MATLRETFGNIADAIRAKGVSGTMTPLEMPDKISSIQSGGEMLGTDISCWGDVITSYRTVGGPYASPRRYAVSYPGLQVVLSSSVFFCRYGHSVDDNRLEARQYLPAVSSITFTDLTGANYIGVFDSMACNNQAVKEINFPKLKSIAGGSSHFRGIAYFCSELTAVNFGEPTIAASGTMLRTFEKAFGYSGLTSVPRIPELTGMVGFDSTWSRAFYDCTKLSDIQSVQDFFDTRAREISSVTGTYLNSMFYSCFYDCNNLSGHLDLDFYKDSSQFIQNIFANTSISSLDVTFHTASPYAQYGFANMSALTDCTVRGWLTMNANQQYMFSGCKKLSSLNLPDLSAYSALPSSILQNCTSLTSINLPGFKTITGSTSAGTTNPFFWCTQSYVKKFSFPNVTNITNKFLFGSTTYSNKVTEIHFGAANQAAIEATAGYATKWGAANATIYFDL